LSLLTSSTQNRETTDKPILREVLILRQQVQGFLGLFDHARDFSIGEGIVGSDRSDVTGNKPLLLFAYG